jgi:hypothetical protein
MPDSTDTSAIFSLGHFVGSDLLNLICQHLGRDERQALRGVNHALRRAMNAAVSRVTCAEATLAAPDLLDVFPNAASLHLNLASATDACALLERMVSGKARLLARLRHISIHTSGEAVESAAFIPAVSAMLSRWACPSLNERLASNRTLHRILLVHCTAQQLLGLSPAPTI